MSQINVCATLGGNTGTPNCDVRMGRIKYIMLTQSKEFTEADLASTEALEEALQAAMLLGSSDANKVYAFPPMREAENTTGDPQTGTLADGYEEVLNEATPKYVLRGTPGTCVHQAMSSFNGWPGKVYIVDENGIFWYRDNGSEGGKGFSIGNLYTQPPNWKGSGDIQTSNTRLSFGSVSEFKTGVGAVKIDFEVSDLSNLKDVTLDDREDENISGALNNVFLIGGKTKCEGTDIYAAYKTLLNSTARWRAYKADGTAITVTNVTTDDAELAWQITLDSTEFNALAALEVFYIDLVPPTTLAAASITGIEGNKLRFIKAA